MSGPYLIQFCRLKFRTCSVMFFFYLVMVFFYKTRFRILRCCVWSVPLYACETWTLNFESKKLLEIVEMWYLIKMERISFTAHKTNEFVLSKTQKSRMILRDIETRQLSSLDMLSEKARWKKTFFPDTSTAKYPEEEIERHIWMVSRKN